MCIPRHQSRRASEELSQNWKTVGRDGCIVEVIFDRFSQKTKNESIRCIIIQNTTSNQNANIIDTRKAKNGVLQPSLIPTYLLFKIHLNFQLTRVNQQQEGSLVLCVAQNIPTFHFESITYHYIQSDISETLLLAPINVFIKLLRIKA